MERDRQSNARGARPYSGMGDVGQRCRWAPGMACETRGARGGSLGLPSGAVGPPRGACQEWGGQPYMGHMQWYQRILSEHKQVFGNSPYFPYFNLIYQNGNSKREVCHNRNTDEKTSS